MPKSKIFWFEAAIHGLAESLKGWQRHRGRSSEEMGVALRCSTNTWFGRLRKPENITVEEAWRAINYLKIPSDEAILIMTAGIEALHKK